MTTHKHICAAVLAHVDAGKTTLSEAMLYKSGSIRKAGRVDNKDAYLDTDKQERDRGITIYSKQAMFTYGDTDVTLLDTPGHVDFSAEMERVLCVLDYAILVVSGADGVQSHTRTLWKLLRRYNVPVFIFVNKMDQNGTDKAALMTELTGELDGSCVDFTSEDIAEEVAMCDEEVLSYYLSEGKVLVSQTAHLIAERKLYPCYFGSALKMQGVEEFLELIDRYTVAKKYPKEFGARVFKIARDATGARLTYIKVTGGSLHIKDAPLGNEKVNQIRIYSGEKYKTCDEASAGMVCAVLGLSDTYPGQGMGCESERDTPVLEPVLTYTLVLPDGVDAASFMPKLVQLEEEDPELNVSFEEHTKEIKLMLMGEVQTQVLANVVKERFGIDIGFADGKIVYRETIADTVEGVGHFEPLRHYAEVHLVIEPAERGSGITIESDCSTDVLATNWQRLILTHLAEKEHKGVLTGSLLTDVKITLKSGRAHIKHTEGGDFRQATYRAVRQGLMQATSVLLEPYYSFVMEVTEDTVGRAMTDIDRMSGTCTFDGNKTITGRAPVSTMQNYQKELLAYTKGLGTLSCTVEGYFPCHDPDEIIENMGYDPEADLKNPTGSVFCAHGAGFVVPWYEVPEYMHLPSCLAADRSDVSAADQYVRYRKNTQEEEIWLGTDEIDAIINRTYNANKKGGGEPSRNNWKRTRGSIADQSSPVVRNYAKTEPQTEYLLVDGYNIIFAWEDLKELADVNIDSARGKLLDVMCNYQAIRGCEVIVVFDAYRVKGHVTETIDYHNVHVVFTREAETADAYIEKFAHENARKYKVTVATSDGLEQIIIRGAGCLLISAREFEQEVAEKSRQITEEYAATNRETVRNRPFESIEINVEE